MTFQNDAERFHVDEGDFQGVLHLWNNNYKKKINPDFEFGVPDWQVEYLKQYHVFPPDTMIRLVYYIAQFPKSENSFYAIYDFTEMTRGYAEWIKAVRRF